MSTNTAYKSNLTVGGSAMEKSKLQLRRPTPDSDALASSDDDRDHVPPVVRPAPGGYPGGRRPSSGWLQDIQPTNRKYSLPSVSFAGSQPTTPSLELPQQARPGPAASAFPWNTTSFTSSQSNSHSRLKEVLPSPTSAFAPHEKPLPSPTNIEGDKGIGFLLDQQNPNPLRKAVRSQSYSIGQGDIESSPVGQFSQRFKTNLRHRPSKPSLLGESAIGLSQLREDDVDDVESSNGSEHGVRLPTGYWDREHKQQVLLKQAAVENARVRNMNPSAGSPISQQRRKTTAGVRNVAYGNSTEYAIEEMDDHEAATAGSPGTGLVRRFSENVTGPGREADADLESQKQQWATGNIAPMNVDPLGRRHSFAHYGSYNATMPQSKLSNTQEEDEDVISPRQNIQQPEDKDAFDAAAYFNGYGPASRAINSSAISIAHPDPIVPNTAMSAANPYAVPQNIGRPGRRLFVVTFKCSRADIYYLYDNTGLEINRGDLVIVEGDRGCDLGQVTHADVSLEDAKKFKAEANEEHFRWLVMFSQYSLAGNSNDSSMLGALARANGFPNPMSRGQITGMGATQDQDAKPKMIKRLAQQHEIMGLRDKEGQEAKAKRLGAQKAGDHKLPMEILDAEYQADYHKLTYFYYAEAYVNFNELVTDLFKQYKVRIWMSAVNPASVVNPAGLNQVPPPSAIGPGAILNSSTPNNAPAVGPGFGPNNNRTYQQQGRGRGNAPYAGNFDDGFNAFSHQLPPFQPPQTAYNMTPWAHGQQMPQGMYGRYGGYGMPAAGYPNASASGSPMNFGQFYPPGTFVPPNAYQVPPNGSPYQGGSPAQPYTGQYTTSGAGMNNTAGNGSQGNTPVKREGAGTPGNHAHANGHSKADGSATISGPSPGAGLDPNLLVAMHNMTFGSK